MKRNRPVPRLHSAIRGLGFSSATAGGIILAYRNREPVMYWLCREIIQLAIQGRPFRARRN